MRTKDFLSHALCIATYSFAVVAEPINPPKAQRSTNPVNYRHPAVKSVQPVNEKRDVGSQYEYIVVGSGGGGGPLAARLAMAGHRTLLLEAGDDQGSNINEQVPAFQGKVTEDPTIRWDYWVKHYSDQARAEKDSKYVYITPSGGQYVGTDPPAGSTPKGILYPRAGTLGGCMEHNALITIYPHQSDWSNIASITGDNSWSPDNMRTYFEKMENCEYLPNSAVGHGFNGWLTTSEANVEIVAKDSKILNWLIAAANFMGSGLLGSVISTATQLVNVLGNDVNSGASGRDGTEGLFQIPLTSDHGKRNGPRDFLISTQNAVNSDGTKMYPLDIQLHTLVAKILFSTNATSGKPQATGVEYLEGQSLYSADPRYGASSGAPGNVTVSREVIVSAGAFNTPQLLKLSGIGPAAELQSFSIPVVVDLPGVGTNLQDRYESGVTTMTDTDFSSTSTCTFNRPGTSDPCLQTWQADQDGDRGIYQSNGFAAAILKKSVPTIPDDDLFIFGGPVSFHGYYPNYADDAVADARHWTWAVLKAHTGNRAGTVTLRSTDPRDTPEINFNYFDTGTTTGGADMNDVNAVVDGIQIARKIAADLPLGSAKFTEVYPGPNVTSTADIQEYVKDNAWGHHASCTCPIGADNDPNAVLDSSFRVRGVDGLRVVDASVFPRIPGIFIAVPVYMISEKAADIIIASASGS